MTYAEGKVRGSSQYKPFNIKYKQSETEQTKNKLWGTKKRMKPHLDIHPSVQMVENKQNVIKPSEYLTDVM